MAEKKKASSKKNSEAKDAVKKSTDKKTTTKASNKKASTKKVEEKKINSKPAKKESKEVAIDTYEAKLKEKKKESKLKRWFNDLSLEQIIIGGVIIIAILLIVLIFVSTKNTKTKDGDDIVVQVDGKTITANELYNELKKQGGYNVAINLIDDYILNKEYKTTDEMKESAEATIESYKNTYGDNYQSFLEYNGLANDAALKELLIKNSKLTSATEDYIKDNLTDKEMKAYYEDEIVGDISAKHILISFDYEDDATDEQKTEAEEKAKKTAEEIIEKLKNGANFDDLAKEYSTDEASKEKGGDLGYFNKGDMLEEFENAAYALDVNEYTTEPVKTTYGYHIIMKTGQKEKPSYEKSKDTITEKLIAQKKEEDSTVSVKAMIALREKYNMKIKDKTVKSDYKDYIDEATTTTTTTSAN